ncbi:MAG: peptide chain release factor 2 [Lysobacterales bacterium]|nr:MAG: peptide chain release factor 2 [Xanthomonadales bacterium]
MDDIDSRLELINERMQDLMVRLDLTQKEVQLIQLQKAAEAPDLWGDQKRAQRTMRLLARYQRELDNWHALEERIKDAGELADLGDAEIKDELAAEISTIESELDRRDTESMLSGQFDDEDAILAIHAGAGGTDSQDWAEMLQRMYLRWAETRGYKAEILDFSEGEEAGIKSVTIGIEGDFAYGYLRSEKGVHRLVRLSPFDSANRRHTSFALVEILPQVETDDEIEINASDLRVDTYRSAGAGGQNVQKNETAIRITHLPTGIVVTCQNERSQMQNKENAMRVLRARLLDLRRHEQEAELAEIRGDYVKAEWGSQIRSYVLHPYQMVKDHRTDYEVGNTQAVLNGDLDGFMESYLRSTQAPEVKT